MPTKAQPPAEIELIYQNPNGRHVFTATGIAGFYYSSNSLEKTFNEVAMALGLHISRLYGTVAIYHLDRDLAEFTQLLETPEEDADVADLLLKSTIIATKTTKTGVAVNR
jgi:hypothetical protein